MFLIGVSTGLRVSDILNLRVRDVVGWEWEEYLLISMYIEVTEQKTGKKRRVLLPPSVRIKIYDHIRINKLGMNDYLIFSKQRKLDRKLSRVHAYRVIKAAAKAAGISGVGTHTMRKTYALNHYRKYRSIEALQKELNHKHKYTTVMYLIHLDSLLEQLE